MNYKKIIVKIIILLFLLFSLNYMFNTLLIGAQNDIFVNQLNGDSVDFSIMKTYDMIKNKYFVGIAIVGLLMFKKEIKLLIKTFTKKIKEEI